jgi:hypothetical protein
MRIAIAAVAAAMTASSACDAGRGAPAGAAPEAREPAPRPAGVWPKDFQCASIASPTDLEQLLGGTPRPLDNPGIPPRGLAAPCKYEVTLPAAVVSDAPARRRSPAAPQPVIEQWQFDFDCRKNMKQTADALFAEYRQRSAEAIATWRHSATAAEPAAATGSFHPGEAVAVDVGAKGLDHHGLALIFLDDDAPCYARIAGPDPARRLALARHIARRLTPDTAPMEPRPRR